MKVLMLNPEFPYSFWSFTQTRRSFGRKALVPPLGLMTVAALLPEEWEVRLVDLNVRKLSQGDWNWAEVVMISAMLVQKQGMLGLIREARQKGKTVVAGGPYPTSLPQEALDAGCDFVVRGEGENTIPLLVSALGQELKQGVIEVNEKPDMSTSPLPRFDLVRPADYVAAAVQTCRGCPFECEFCDVVSLFGRKPRFKSPDQVIQELESLYRLGWRDHVFVSDDNFIGSRTHARALLAELIPWSEGRGEPFTFLTQASLNLGQDKEMIDLMTKANFWSVFIGIESPDENVLVLNRKFQNTKNPIVESLDNIKKNGLLTIASFVIGFDGEAPGIGERICDLIEKTDVPLVSLNTVQALPNTSLWNRLKAENRLLEHKTGGDTTAGRLNFIPSRPEGEIMAELTAAWQRLYDPSHYLERTYRYYLSMRPTRRSLGAEKPSAAPVLKERISPRRVLFDLYLFLRLLWVHSVRYGLRHRRLFWKQLAGVLLKNPSRTSLYVNAVALGENMFALTDEIRTRTRTAMESDDTMSGPAAALGDSAARSE